MSHPVEPAEAARALFDRFPNVSVLRDRLGFIEVNREIGGVVLSVLMHSVYDEAGKQDLRLVGSKGTRGVENPNQTIVTIPGRPGPGQRRVLQEDKRGASGPDPDELVAVAAQGTWLLASYLALPPDVRHEYQYIPGGNAKIYDWYDSPEQLAADLREAGVPTLANSGTDFNVLPLARRVLLSEQQ